MIFFTTRNRYNSVIKYMKIYECIYNETFIKCVNILIYNEIINIIL